MDRAPNDPQADELSLVAASLERWPAVAGGTPVLINLSENHTFRIDGPKGAHHVLRLHRPRYQSRAAIGSELSWLEAITDETEIPVPRPVPGADGEIVQEVAPDRYAAMFAFEPGEEPQADADLVPLFATLGNYAATLHNHVSVWQQPEHFVRPIWDAVSILEPSGLWGDWRKAPHVEGETLAVLTELDSALRADLRAYGTDIDRFGLIHADMRLANLLVDGETTVLLDFDDCGHGWFLYDLAASLSFIETSPQVPALIRAWLSAYIEVRPLKADDFRMIDAMILLRRMALLAWIGSHAETDLAKAHADRFALDTAALAEKYLAR
ncbi:phosphotransferase [Devosia sp. ZB163]|uniref:phosphotransferase enzyme family protein n=1 Tax=Devosia sp. ZB163 TaxID=3025938 RepID=UPI00236313CC|nr:phosphotransferase [Devosia sp. ZB163]MDC9824308.1 phosphotransferase [Devosia sp. ZB163]